MADDRGFLESGLLSSAQTLLKDSVMPTPAQNCEAVSRDDVIWCYRNLLGREPESDTVVDGHSRNKSFRRLVQQFVDSAEFRTNMGAVKAAAENNPRSLAVDCNLVRMLRDRHQVVSLEVKPT